MKKLGPGGVKWLKTLHLLAVCCWIGGAVSLLVLHGGRETLDGGALHGVNHSMHRVDMAVVVVFGAFGCLVTGLLYSLFTNWGFFRHGWLVFKWVATVGAILFGTFFLGPWETRMLELSRDLGLAAQENAEYLRSARLNLGFGLAQVALLAVMVWLSVFRPWGRKKGSGLA